MGREGLFSRATFWHTRAVLVCGQFGGPGAVRGLICALVCSFFTLSLPSAGEAQDTGLSQDVVARGAPVTEPGPTLDWGNRPRFSLAESISTGVMAAGLLAMHFGDLEREGTPWTGRIFFDEGARSGLRGRSDNGRSIAAGLSDVLLYTLQLYPFVVDTGLTALAAHRSPDVAAQMFLINMQSFALTSLVTLAAKVVARRERPYGRNCREGDPGCDGGSRYASFFSGHTSMAFTGAGLICAHHTSLPLYQDPAADRAACFTAMGAAATVGALRMVADKHYMSDVLLGATVGILSGFVMPKLLHYRNDDEPSGDEPRIRGQLAPLAGPRSVGVSYQGMF